MNSSELRTLIALNTLVFETLGQPEKEREFNFKALKRWGLDLLAGKRNGQDSLFVGEQGKYKVADSFDQAGEHFQVNEILSAFPKGSKLLVHIQMIEGTAFLIGELRNNTQNMEVLRIEAPSLLMAFTRKHGLPHVGEAIRSVGTATELVKHRGQEGKPMPFNQLPNVPRRFLREAKKIEKSMGFGRVSLAFFGENKDKDARFRLSWLVPTVSLLDIDCAEKIDKLLSAFK